MDDQPTKYTGTWIPAIVMLDQELSLYDKAVYAEIASYPTFFGTNDFLAKRLNISVRKVQYSIKLLQDKGFIGVETNGPRRTCMVTMHIVHAYHAPGAYINKRESKKKEFSSSKPDVPPPSFVDGEIEQEEARAAGRGSSRVDWDGMLTELSEALGKPKTRNTPGRITKLKQRLKNYSLDELKSVAKKISADDFMVAGDYNNIDYLLRNDEKVDMWLQRGAPTTIDPATPQGLVATNKKDTTIERLREMSDGTSTP